MEKTIREFNAAPRLLLRRLREIMAKPMAAQERLDTIVRQIAQSMVAEVCSAYVLRADGVLELFATVGLDPKAVHAAQLSLGQGLVGVIAASARPLNLSDASKHPAFKYLPETGEEPYNAFMGVPILRAGRTLGVLVIQNESQRIYGDDEVEAMETVAMVVGELVAAGELRSLSSTGIDLDLTKPVTSQGNVLNEGIGLGHVVLHEARIVVTELFAEDAGHEMARLREAIGALRLTIDDMLERREVNFEGEHRDVLETYRMFAHDKGWVARIEEAIRNGLTAEAGVEKVQSDMRARMSAVTDPYMRERMSDFDGLANKLLRQLMGKGSASDRGEMPDDSVIVARTMGAADLLDYPRTRIRGLVLEDGTAASHVAIVARAMGIPVVGQNKGIVAMADHGDAIIVDGLSGLVHLRPQPEVESAYAEKVRFRAKRQEEYRLLRDAPSRTLDGEAFELFINAGLLVDLPQLDDSGANGIGLYRTELQFMIASAFPRAEAQESLYRKVIETAGDRPVLFRTLDIGGDKVLPYFKNAPDEENPAIGWRAVRIALDRPGLFRTQIRALLRAAAGKRLSIMLPMVTDVSELDEARRHIDAEVRHLSKHGHALPTRLKVGVMLEVPSLLFQLDTVMKRADFVSIGSNDLQQFLNAADRGNPSVAGRYDCLSQPMLRALKSTVEAADKAGTELSLCGEMAAKPVEAMTLVAIGLKRLSLSPAAIGPVKAALRATHMGKLRAHVADALAADGDRLAVRQAVQEFANENDIAL